MTNKSKLFCQNSSLSRHFQQVIQTTGLSLDLCLVYRDRTEKKEDLQITCTPKCSASQSDGLEKADLGSGRAEESPANMAQVWKW